MDEFQKYNNTAGFFVGNEVLTTGKSQPMNAHRRESSYLIIYSTGDGSVAAPYVKAAARDVKAYRNSKNYRNIPVGYSAGKLLSHIPLTFSFYANPPSADISSLRPMLQNYLACGTNSSESLDFFSLNAYEWCGTSSYTVSGYSELTANVTTYNIPIFFSETGCIKPRPRTFEDQAAIFGDKMTPYWSGAIIYEWIEESNDYGLVSYGKKVDPTASDAPPDGYTRSGTPTPISPDFTYLSNQWKTLTPSGVKESDYTPTLTPPPCPAYTSGVWEVNGGVTLPSLGQTFDAAIQSSITKGTAAGGTGAAATPTKTGAASVGKEVKGMSVGLVTVMLTFFWWM